MMNNIKGETLTITIPSQHRPIKFFKDFTKEIEKNLLMRYIAPSTDGESFSLNMKIDFDAKAIKEYTITINDIDGQTEKLESIISKCIFNNYNEMGI